MGGSHSRSERRNAPQNKPVPPLPKPLDDSHYQAVMLSQLHLWTRTVVRFDRKFMPTLAIRSAEVYDGGIGLLGVPYIAWLSVDRLFFQWCHRYSNFMRIVPRVLDWILVLLSALFYYDGGDNWNS